MTPFIISGNPFQDETYLITKQMDFPTFFILNPILGKIKCYCSHGVVHSLHGIRPIQ